MKYVSGIKESVQENALVVRASYGSSFWLLIFGVALAVSLVGHMELSRAKPVVERIPASEVSEITKKK